MGEQYGLPDLRQMMAGRAHFPGVSHVGEPFLGHQSLTPAQHYEMGMVGEMLLPPPPQTQQRNVEFRSDSSSVSGFEESGGVGGNGRWPRQETLTLLEIRSRLDHKFKEANHKGPLWDEVSRIMAEEHGYQRSGKKCREKLENLYKYYKKTKEGKAGRQDGKHYRFFRQLEALYGENSNPALETNVVDKNQCQQISNPSTSQANQEPLHAQKFCESLSLSNSSEFNTSSSSSDDEDLSGIAIKEGDVINTKKDTNGLKRGRKSWRSKVRDFIDLQMKKFMGIQETWLEKMLKTLEHQEKERIAREEAWRKQESERFDREHKFWESERAWIEARDAALVEALKKFSAREFKAPLSPEELHTTIDTDRDGENACQTFQSMINNRRWLESELLCLIKLRSAMESSFQEFGGSKLAMWEEISAKMGGMGYERSAKRCKEKWEYINKYLKKTEDCNKKRKENSITCPYVHHLDSLYSQRGGICGQEPNDQTHETMGHRSSDGPSPSNPNVGLAANDSCLRFLMADGDNLWENYGIKLSTGGNQ